MDNNTMDFSDLKNFIQNNYEYNKLKKKRRKKIIVVLINIISIACLIGGGIGLKSIFDYEKDLKVQEQMKEELDLYSPAVSKIDFNENITTDEKTIDPEITKLFDDLSNKNNDTVAWLKVRNTSVNTAIVQSKDNKYYLTHNFNKEYNSLGWAFADYRNTFPDLGLNTIIYGHTYKRTLVFSSLVNVLNKSWLNNKDNWTIEFTTKEAKLEFRIFSIYTIKKTNDYLNTEFTPDEYMEFVNLIKNRSIKDFETEVNFKDKILTLSTCYNTSKYRLVIHAKLINQSEE